MGCCSDINDKENWFNDRGASIATRAAASEWGGVMIKLSGLYPCLLYSVFYFNSVACRLLLVSY